MTHSTLKMDLSEAFKFWAMYLLVFLVYNIAILLVLNYFSSKHNIIAKNKTITFFKFSSIFLVCLHISGMMISSSGPKYIFNFLAYMFAFISFVFLVALGLDNYKFKLFFNMGSGVLVYFFNLMAIFFNHDSEDKNKFLLNNPNMMIVPASSCALQVAYFFYNIILYNYQHYNILTITADVPDEDCSICLENLKETQSCKLRCNHYFHYNCIMTNFNSNNKCPICRTEFILTQV